MKIRTAASFIRDRFIYILTGFVITGLGAGLMLLEHARNPEFLDLHALYYFIGASAVFIVLSLTIDYIRQREYYKQILSAIERDNEIQTGAIAQSAVTAEQQYIVRLLEQQSSAYLNQLGAYQRKQELHNHFVLQWVHHMKTPLSVIDLLLQEAAIQQSLSEEEQHELNLSLFEEADRMSKGLEMLLHTARLEKFEMDLHLVKLSLHGLIHEVLITHRRLCVRHHVIPQIHGEASPETDRKWITVVLNQIVSNAIKYSKDKQGIKPLVFHLEQQDSVSKLMITDKGSGIASHDLMRIFDPFFTGENGQVAGESTGMGLYLAKQICSRLGHELTVSSKLGVGTTVTLTFPSKGIHILDGNK
ncbi:sensor histidine kinase [Paenibacillus paeoniae]|uniref:histidine kinase n=1 Tax=Paenibacillus paeoniae TaxID=2292705 RepID=A0A371PLL2_9BACL|nr:sensor histidine kinase [Paenibacillus paeoniae]REK76875.1 sensor histidine kinase [Paenibacillus paeoniae]